MPSSLRPRTRGLTLVELLASLALLGGVLGGAVLAKARLSRQWSAAQHRLVAVERLDAMLERWHAEGHIPPNASGTLSSAPLAPPEAGTGTDRWDELNVLDTGPNRGLRWSTSLVDEPALLAHGIQLIRVAVHFTQEDKPRLLLELDLLSPDTTALTPQTPTSASDEHHARRGRWSSVPTRGGRP